MTDQAPPVTGRNGVAITRAAPVSDRPRGYRTYEVHQRQRVGASTEKLRPLELVGDAFRRDPYPTLAVLRERYPCYRDWQANRYWLTRYDDVTSVFADDANFTTRSKLWYLGLDGFGVDLGNTLEALHTEARLLDDNAGTVAERLADALAAGGDLARDFAAALPLQLLAVLYAIPAADQPTFFTRYWRAQRGVSWQPTLQHDGRAAVAELVDYFAPLLQARRNTPGDDMLSTLAQLDVSGRPAAAADIVTTLLTRDHATLHSALANLWLLLLTHPDALDQARAERRLLKLAYLETLRHSAPVLGAERFARHEVERFGVLLPEGALVWCSAAAANRDPRVFADPDRFIVDRRDLCQREPRGQYRADGLASGIAFGLGKPSVHPALPEDRPRSRYALTRDIAVTASTVLLATAGVPRLATDAQPCLTALTLGETHTCWQLPVRFD